jgi:hypothetical protein
MESDFGRAFIPGSLTDTVQNTYTVSRSGMRMRRANARRVSWRFRIGDSDLGGARCPITSSQTSSSTYLKHDLTQFVEDFGNKVLNSVENRSIIVAFASSMRTQTGYDKCGGGWALKANLERAFGSKRPDKGQTRGPGQLSTPAV